MPREVEVPAANGDRSFFSKDGTAIISLRLQNVTELLSAMDPASFRAIASMRSAWIAKLNLRNLTNEKVLEN